MTTASFTRKDGRAVDELRPVTMTRHWLDHAEGSVLVTFGRTRVLCAASFTEGVPRWRKGSGAGGAYLGASEVMALSQRNTVWMPPCTGCCGGVT